LPGAQMVGHRSSVRLVWQIFRYCQLVEFGTSICIQMQDGVFDHQ
jgi:hypothetical protein